MQTHMAKSECMCEVCVALRPLVRMFRAMGGNEDRGFDLAPVIGALPESVQRVLSAQGRVLADTATDEDRELIAQAAARCTQHVLCSVVLIQTPPESVH